MDETRPASYYEQMVCVYCAVSNPLCNEDIPCVGPGGERFTTHLWGNHAEIVMGPDGLPIIRLQPPANPSEPPS